MKAGAALTVKDTKEAHLLSGDRVLGELRGRNVKRGWYLCNPGSGNLWWSRQRLRQFNSKLEGH